MADAGHCLLQDKLQRWLLQGEPLTIPLTGGSASAMRCPGAEGFRFHDRFAYQLKDIVRDLRAGPLKAPAIGQGETDSMFSALLLDSLVDLPNTDVLVWEFSINDSCNKGRRTPHQMAQLLDLWLYRVASLPSQPAVILLYLWSHGSCFGSTFPESRTWEAGVPVIRHYLRQGMDISVLNVASGLAGEAKSILKDIHHPNCNGNQYIADILTYHMLREAEKAVGAAGTETTMLSERQSLCEGSASKQFQGPGKGQVIRFGRGASVVPFQAHKNREKAVQAIIASSSIKALHNWLPQDGRRPLVSVSSNAVTERHAGAKFTLGRADRKVDFAVPTCASAGGPLVFAIEEPGVMMVALGSKQPQRALGNLVVQINGAAVMPATIGSKPSPNVLWPCIESFFPLWFWPAAMVGSIKTVSVCTSRESLRHQLTAILLLESTEANIASMGTAT